MVERNETASSEVVIRKNALECSVFKPLGCEAIKGDPCCVELKANCFFPPCSEDCYSCEKECVHDIEESAHYGFTTTTDICSVQCVADKLADFYDCAYDYAARLAVSLGELAVQVAMDRNFCRCCEIGQTIYDNTMSIISERQKEYEEMMLEAIVGTPIEDFVNQVNEEMWSMSDEQNEAE